MQGMGRQTQQGNLGGGMGDGGPQASDGYGPPGGGDGMVSSCLRMHSVGEMLTCVYIVRKHRSAFLGRSHVH